MSTVVGLRFPWGRYHATSWERAANEGVAEWPPAPWRLLRALFATSRYSMKQAEHGAVDACLTALAVAPAYRLPRRFAAAHTRHYMPDATDARAKVFDPFVAFDPGEEILVRWDVDLDGVQRRALAQACERLAYLGRAEAVCRARLVPLDEHLPPDRWSAPGAPTDLAATPRRVLAPREPLDLAALVLRTTDVRRSRRLTPPGTRWLAYDVADSPPPGRHPRPRPDRHRTTESVLLCLDAAVLPSVRDTVWVADVARRAAMCKRATPSPILSGKDGNGELLTGHGHAHFLPLDRDRDGFLDSIVVWAPSGLDDGDVAALASLRRLTSGVPGFRPLRVALGGAGPVAEIAPSLTSQGPAADWVSLTPFAPYRHQKKEPDGQFYAAEVARELQTRGLPAAELGFVTSCSWLDWKRSRPGRPPDLRATGLRLRLSSPMSGPLALGALSHYGLGLFVPDDGGRHPR